MFFKLSDKDWPRAGGRREEITRDFIWRNITVTHALMHRYLLSILGNQRRL